MKRSISLILAIVMVFCFCIVPAVAEGEPTATITATVLDGAAPQPGELFFVSVDLSKISTELFKGGRVQFEWPADVASLADSEDGTEITDASDVDFAIDSESINNPFVSKKQGKFQILTSEAECNLAEGKAAYTLYIDINAKDQESEAAENGDYKLFNIAFVLKEGKTIEDFYFTITATSFSLVAAGSDVFSTMENGAITAVNITKAVSVGPIVVGDATYNVVSDNLITVGYDGFTSATGAVLPWEVVENPEYTVSGGPSIHGTGDLKGGSDGNTMRTFFPITGGKTYYVTNTVYNNTGAVTTSHSTTGMRGIIATGDPVFGTFENLTMYSHVDYGGVSSWSAESDHKGTNYVGTPAGRDDGSYEIGLSTVGYIINAPAEATNIMISYGAWSKNEIYYGDFAIYEVEVSSVKEKAAVTFEYKAGDEVLKTAEVEGYIGDTVEVGAVKFVKNHKVYTAEAASAEVVSGGVTVEVPATEVTNVVFAEKTESFNVSTNSVYPYPTGRVVELEGTDVIYSASWGDTRYGEVYLPLTVSEGEGVNSAVLTLTPADVMGGQANTFAIYAADPATYGTANDLEALEIVGEGTFEAVDAAKDITLDLTQYFNNYPEAEGILLLYKVTGGLMAAYGASFEEAPYLTYEIGEAAAPTEPSTSEEPTSPSEEPSGEPTSPSEEPSGEPTSPSEEPSGEPTSPSEEPSGEPTSPSEEPSDVPSTEPTSEPEVPTIPEGAIIAVPNQPGEGAGVYTLEAEITVTAKVTFAVTIVSENQDTLVALNDSAKMEPSKYFSESAVMFLVSGGKLKYRSGNDTIELADYTVGETYSFDVDVDVENQTYSFTVTDAEGEVVGTKIENAAFRNETAAIDSIVLANNKGEVDSLYVTDLVVDVPAEPVAELPFEDNGTETIITPAGITVNAHFANETGEREGERVVVVISVLKDNKPYATAAAAVIVKDGKIDGGVNLTTADTGEFTLAGVSVLADTDPTTVIISEGNLGTPIGVLKN